MKLTKYAHSCIALEDNGTKIVIDPGEVTPDTPTIMQGAAALLITHKHMDHLDKTTVQSALDSDPKLTVYCPGDVTGELTGNVVGLTPGETFAVGDFSITTVGGTHAEIHPDIPSDENLGFLINDMLYHPGDSFDVPDQPVAVLLVPTSGPWMKTGEAADFVRAVKPKRIIEIHEGVDSDMGHNLAAMMLGKNGLTGLELEQLSPGESIDL